MKRYILVCLSLLSLVTVAIADEEKICEQLFDRAWSNCSKYMCEDAGLPKNCDIDSDGMEGVQICVTEGELDKLIKAYNRRNPRSQVECKDI